VGLLSNFLSALELSTIIPKRFLLQTGGKHYALQYVSRKHFSSYSGISQEELLLVPLKTLSPFIFSSNIGSRDMEQQL
jgi:hypothetical protein